LGKEIFSAINLVDFSEESATYGDENNPTFSSSEEFWAMNLHLTQQFNGNEDNLPVVKFMRK